MVLHGITYAQIIPAAFCALHTVQPSVHSPCSSSKYTTFFIACATFLVLHCVCRIPHSSLHVPRSSFFIAHAAFLVVRCMCCTLTSSCSMYSVLQSMILRLQKVVCTVVIHQLQEDCLFTRCETECRLCSCGVEHVQQCSMRVK